METLGRIAIFFLHFLANSPKPEPPPPKPPVEEEVVPALKIPDNELVEREGV